MTLFDSTTCAYCRRGVKHTHRDKHGEPMPAPARQATACNRCTDDAVMLVRTGYRTTAEEALCLRCLRPEHGAGRPIERPAPVQPERGEYDADK